jgi:ATP synthase I chain
VFAHFSLPNVPDVARRTISTVLVVGVAALVACIAFGQPLVGLGACIGLALGTLNFRMIGNSVARVSARPDGSTRKPLALNTMGRMGIITVVTIGLLLLSPGLGFGVLGGLAVFQVVLLANVARSMAKAGPMTSVDDAINAPVVDTNITRSELGQLPGQVDDSGPEG